MEQWLKCKIMPGQFTGEYAIQGELFDSTTFSLFASEADVQLDEKPVNDKPVKGHIRVILCESKDGLSMVSLPRPTFENGRTITIKANMLEKSPR